MWGNNFKWYFTTITSQLLKTKLIIRRDFDYCQFDFVTQSFFFHRLWQTILMLLSRFFFNDH